MSAGKVIGGLFALIAGVFVLYAVFMQINLLSSGIENNVINWVINLLVALLAIVGGILGIASKGGAGALTLIAGIMAFLMGLIANFIPTLPLSWWFDPYSGLALLTSSNFGQFIFGGSGITWFISFEGFLIFIGAIMILNSREEV